MFHGENVFFVNVSHKKYNTNVQKKKKNDKTVN